MKKRNWKRVLSAGLALSMVFSMAACGNKKSGGKSPSGNVGKDYAKQGVFSYDEIKMPLGDNFSVIGSRTISDKIYLLMEVYDSETWEQTLHLVSMAQDGGNVTDIQLQIPSEAGDAQVSVETVPDPDAPQTGDTEPEKIIPKGGAMAKSVIFAKPADDEDDEDADIDDDDAEEDVDDDDEDDADFGDDDDADIDDGEDTDDDGEDGEDGDFDVDIDWGDGDGDWEYIDWDDTDGEDYSYSAYQSGAISAEGMIYAIRYSSEEDYSDPDNYRYEEKHSLVCWDASGVYQWETDLTDTWNQIGDAGWFNGLVPMVDGNITLLTNGDKLGQIIVDKSGNVKKAEKLERLSVNTDTLQSTMIREDGKVLMTYYEGQDYEKLCTVEFDPVKGTADAPTEIPKAIMNNGFYSVYPGYDTDFIYCTSEGLFTYNRKDADSVKMMDFVNSDINIGSFSRVVMTDATHFIGFYNDAMQWNSCVALFTKVDPADIKDKELMVIGGLYVTDNSNLKERVIQFNKSSKDYRIVLRDYSSDDDSDDGSASYTKLNNDIISGNMPDVLLLNESLPVESYISKGLLADIDELIQKDEELSKVEFMDNIFDAYRVNGKLYQIVPSYVIQTYIAKSSLVGDLKGWNMQDLNAIKPKLPEGISIFSSEMTRGSFLSSIMRYCGNDFVDVNSGKCNFDTQEFLDLLEMAKSFPEEVQNDDDYSDNWWMKFQSQYRENRTLLRDLYLSSFRWVKEDINGYMGEDVSYVGFPTENRKGSVVMAYETYAIAAKSANIDGAWEFMRYYLTEEYQKSDDFWGLSVHKKILEEAKQQSMEKSYWTDENGQKVEYEDTFYINGEEVPYQPLNKEQADELFDFVCSVTSRAYSNESVESIVMEEAAAFFSGQKSAKDVAGLIQNRVQLYINENR